MMNVKRGGRKKEVPTQRAQCACQQHRAASDKQRHEHHRQQEHQARHARAGQFHQAKIHQAGDAHCTGGEEVLVEGGLKRGPPRRSRRFGSSLLRAHHVQINITALPGEPAEQTAATPPLQPARAGRLAHDDLCHVLIACHAEQAAHEVLVRSGENFRAQRARGREIVRDLHLRRFGQHGRTFDIHCEPRTAQPIGHAARPSDQRLGHGAWADGDQQTMVGLPRAGPGLRAAEFARTFAHMVGNETQ